MPPSALTTAASLAWLAWAAVRVVFIVTLLLAGQMQPAFLVILIDVVVAVVLGVRIFTTPSRPLLWVAVVFAGLATILALVQLQAASGSEIGSALLVMALPVAVGIVTLVAALAPARPEAP